MRSERQTTFRNHYVPQFYLRQWSTNGHSVCEYDTIVSDEGVNLWKRRSIKSAACQHFFYTSLIDGKEDDSFEVLMERRFETPAKSAFEKAGKGCSLDGEDVSVLVEFLIAQIMRTPAFFLYGNRLFEKLLVETAESTIRDVLEGFDGSELSEETVGARRLLREPYGTTFGGSVETKGDELTVSLETYFGRRAYLNMVSRSLDGAVGEHLRSLNWRVFDVPEDCELFASDNPVVVLRMCGNEIMVGLGMGLDAGTIMMPLSPDRLLLTRVGFSREEMDSLALHRHHFELFQKATILNAVRYVYSSKPDQLVERVRPRVVSRDVFDCIKSFGERWGAEQAEIEQYFDRINRRNR